MRTNGPVDYLGIKFYERLVIIFPRWLSAILAIAFTLIWCGLGCIIGAFLIVSAFWLALLPLNLLCSLVQLL